MQHVGRCRGKAKLKHKGTMQRVLSIGGSIVSQQLLGGAWVEVGGQEPRLYFRYILSRSQQLRTWPMNWSCVTWSMWTKVHRVMVMGQFISVFNLINNTVDGMDRISRTIPVNPIIIEEMLLLETYFISILSYSFNFSYGWSGGYLQYIRCFPSLAENSKKCRTRSSLELGFGSVNFGLILIIPLSCHWHLLIHLGASSAHSSKDLEPWRLGWPKNQNLSVASYVNELCCFIFVLNFSFVPDLPSVLPPPEIWLQPFALVSSQLNFIKSGTIHW